ncbi:conjugative transposon protein TraK [Sphingobacterium phlebotomi]|uniref:Conjugative transposon protein TraK n=1 Tax=Sphingobacterium phlebotomi TaxID=2605433 RepID=A0A5D4H9V3_9SPHI|nr:conjugative transposon protein TraK [Sphingobacterium phlebotomi]
MFKQFNNIETSFRHVKLFTFVIIAACVVVCCFTIHRSYLKISEAEGRIYILANEKAFEASAEDRNDNLPVEARSHIRSFHSYFFTLDPDNEVIKRNIGRALYLADGSARKQYDDLQESNFYANIISGNISQTVAADSIIVEFQEIPFRFRYHGKQKIIRPTAIVTRTLITEGQLRIVARSDNNPHGFLIERWNIIENTDLDSKRR